MKSTFEPEYNNAKAFGTDMRISTKSAEIICNVIRNKPLTRVKRLLEDLVAERRSLRGKYYSKTVKSILNLINSCEKNAEFKGLDMDRLFVHASAHVGPNIKRRRRKGAFGSRMKSTHMEVILIERGKQPADKVAKKKIKEQIGSQGKEAAMEQEKDKEEIRKELEKLREEQKELQKDVEKAEGKIEEHVEVAKE